MATLSTISSMATWWEWRGRGEEGREEGKVSRTKCRGRGEGVGRERGGSAGGEGREWGGSGEGEGREWGGSGEGEGREWGGSGEGEGRERGGRGVGEGRERGGRGEGEGREWGGSGEGVGREREGGRTGEGGRRAKGVESATKAIVHSVLQATERERESEHHMPYKFSAVLAAYKIYFSVNSFSTYTAHVQCTFDINFSE